MSTLRPPVLATWLLEHLYCRPNDESLTGDLFEEYRQGRSRVWYWKEVLAAITIGLYRELAAHPVRALRAIALAWAVRFLSVYCVARILFATVNPWAAINWLWWTSVRPVSPLEMIWWTMDSALCAVAGWTVGRFHRPNRRAMVLVAATSVFFYQLRGLPWIWFHAKNTLTDSRFLPYLVADFVSLMLPPLSVLIGGLWGALSMPDSIRSHFMGNKDAT